MVNLARDEHSRGPELAAVGGGCQPGLLSENDGQMAGVGEARADGDGRHCQIGTGQKRAGVFDVNALISSEIPAPKTLRNFRSSICRETGISLTRWPTQTGLWLTSRIKRRAATSSIVRTCDD